MLNFTQITSKQCLQAEIQYSFLCTSKKECTRCKKDIFKLSTLLFKIRTLNYIYHYVYNTAHIYLKRPTSVANLMEVQSKEAAQYILGYVYVIVKGI